MTKEKKQEIVTQFGKHENDSGSPAVQVALLSERISYLTEHFKTHKKDHTSRRGLLILVGQRAKLMRYIKKNNPALHADLLKRLGIRK